MMKRIVICFALIATMMLCVNSGYADDHRVELGDLGIYFSVDSKYDIITNDNKEEYSQSIQQSLVSENMVLAYAEGHGSILIAYDQGKNYQKYDFSNKKADDLPYLYDRLIDLDETAKLYGDYELSVYDSGKTKWRVAYFPAYNFSVYATVYGQKLVVVTGVVVSPGLSEMETIIDSFEFGSPSFWVGVKSLAGKITDFSRNLLGGFGVYLAWSTIIGVLLSIVSMIGAAVIAVVKKLFG